MTESPSNPPTPSQATLERNLVALAGVDPLLFERLTWPVASDHVRVLADGAWQFRVHKTWHPLEPGGRLLDGLVKTGLETAATSIGTPRRALLLGIGSGALVERLLHVPELREVRAWERDPWLLRLALSCFDLAGAIASRRLRLLLTTDLIGQRSSGSAVFTHPFLGSVYGRELLHMDAPLGKGAVALAAGGLFVDQVGSELTARGFTPWTIDLEVLSEEEVAHSLRYLNPRFLVAINYTQGLAKLSQDHGLPVRVWEVDPASSPPRNEGVSTAGLHLFTHAHDNVEPWRAAGFEHVSYLALAADPAVRKGDDSAPKKLEYGLTFVGQSLAGNAAVLGGRFLSTFGAWRGEAADAEARELLSKLVAGQRAHFQESVIPELLEEYAPGFRATATGPLALEDPAVLAGELAASEKRLTCIAALGEFSPNVWGDEGWRQLESHGTVYHGPAGHGAELTRIYDQSTINLDVGRLYQAGIVTMRVFDALSCGSLVLTERNAALEQLFDVESEVATYSSLKELINKSRYFLEHPKEALETAARGRDAVLARHTIAQRVDVILDGLLGRPGQALECTNPLL